MKVFVSNALKRVLALFLAIIAFFGIIGMNSPSMRIGGAADDGTMVETNIYVQVTDVSTLKAGDKIVIVAPEQLRIMTVQNSGNYRDQAEVVIDENKTIKNLPVNTAVLTLKEGTTAGTFVLEATDGYLNYTGSSNTITTVETLNDTCEWTIEIDSEGVTHIINAKVADTERQIRYNASSPRFACYKGTMQEIAIYKAKATEVCAHKNTTTSYQHATCTADGLRKVVCNDCSAVVEEEVVLELGHEYVNGKCEKCDANESEQPVVQKGSYVKVTEAPADWSGKYLIVYENSKVAFNGSLTEKLDVALKAQAVDIQDGKIKEDDDINGYTFTIASVEGGYSIKSASGRYIGKTSDGNGMNESTTQSYVNTISLDAGGNAHIVSGNAVLRYNSASDQLRFRYYKSTSYTGQKAIALYRYEEPTEPTPETPVIPDGVTEFQSLEPTATLKVVYGENEEVVANKICFGVTIAEALFNTLDASFAQYGIEAKLSDGTVGYFFFEDKQPKPKDGAYNFSLTFSGMEGFYDEEITARVFVKIDGKRYYTQTVTASVNSLLGANA